MTAQQPIRLVGGTGSPYTQKMVALLRYRRVPYAITWGQPDQACDALGVEKPKPIFMPTFFFEEEGGLKATTDSTPIIRRLEEMYPGRSVLPEDPALAFIDYLIEDFADEWCTKYMFHYRWYPEVDADNAGTLLPLGYGREPAEGRATSSSSTVCRIARSTASTWWAPMTLPHLLSTPAIGVSWPPWKITWPTRNSCWAIARRQVTSVSMAS